jgi:hypothetical protein
MLTVGKVPHDLPDINLNHTRADEQAASCTEITVHAKISTYLSVFYCPIEATGTSADLMNP